MKKKDYAFAGHQPDINIPNPRFGKPNIQCPLCKRHFNVKHQRCPHCGVFLGVYND